MSEMEDKRSTAQRFRTTSRVMEVALGKMTVSGRIQRDLNNSRVDYLRAHLDLDDLGLPVLNYRDGKFYIVDGQHRVKAVIEWLGDGWELQKIQCRVYENLSEKEEADMFDRLNDVLRVSAFAKFKTRLTALRPIETDIERIVRNLGLCISKDDVPGGISCVSVLVKVYNRANGPTLGKALGIIRDAYGDTGFEAIVIDGIGHLCQRYNGVLNPEVLIDRLSTAHGGVKGLINKAAQIHQATGQPKAQCIAHAAVEIVNAKRGSGKKIPSWIKMQAENKAAKERVTRYADQQAPAQ